MKKETARLALEACGHYVSAVNYLEVWRKERKDIEADEMLAWQEEYMYRARQASIKYLHMRSLMLTANADASAPVFPINRDTPDREVQDIAMKIVSDNFHGREI